MLKSFGELMTGQTRNQDEAIIDFLQRYSYLIMGAIAVVLLAVSELRFFYDHHPHWQIFVKEIAFALIIAVLYGMTIEKYQRQEFVRLVNKEREDLKRD